MAIFNCYVSSPEGTPIHDSAIQPMFPALPPLGPCQGTNSRTECGWKPYPHALFGLVLPGNSPLWTIPHVQTDPCILGASTAVAKNQRTHMMMSMTAGKGYNCLVTFSNPGKRGKPQTIILIWFTKNSFTTFTNKFHVPLQQVRVP